MNVDRTLIENTIAMTALPSIMAGLFVLRLVLGSLREVSGLTTAVLPGTARGSRRPHRC